MGGICGGLSGYKKWPLSFTSSPASGGELTEELDTCALQERRSPWTENCFTGCSCSDVYMNYLDKVRMFQGLRHIHFIVKTREGELSQKLQSGANSCLTSRNKCGISYDD